MSLPLPTERESRLGVLAAVAIGGALGASARYGMGRAIHVAPGGFPWSTFWINVTGSLALGFTLVLFTERIEPPRHLRVFLVSGLLGAYTTFAALTVEFDLLVKDGHPMTAMGYLAATLCAGIAATWVGMHMGRLGARRA